MRYNVIGIMSRIPPTAGHPRATGWQSATSPTGKHGWQCKCTTGNLKYAGREGTFGC